MIVTLDGPAGAGKSTVARALARRLGFRLLNTGAMYRAVALAAMRAGLDWNDPKALAALARRINIELRPDHVLLDGEDVTAEIRSSQITDVTHYAAGNPEVREHLVQLQRQAAGNDNIVAEGRDQGSVVFPQRPVQNLPHRQPRRTCPPPSCSICNPAASRSRWPRCSVNKPQRDLSDRSRSVGPLVAAPDAIRFSTDGLTEDEVVDRLEAIVREKMQNAEGNRRQPIDQAMRSKNVASIQSSNYHLT